MVGYAGYTAKQIDFPFAEVKRLTGLEVSTDESREILTRLGFAVTGSGERVQVSVPSWRPDVDGKADLVEEVMRIHGVDAIKAAPLPAKGSVNGRILTTLQIRTRAAKRALAARGMLEAVTWSFIRRLRPSSSAAARRRLRSPIRLPPTCPTCGPRCCRAC